MYEHYENMRDEDTEEDADDPEFMARNLGPQLTLYVIANC